jgi:F-type H+-transporting ATPase subunit b
MDALIGTFHIDLKMVIFQLLNFAIVFFVLYKFAIKPISKLMDERSQEIDTGLKDAGESKILKEKMLADYKTEMGKARAESQALFDQMKKEVDEKRAALLADAQTEVDTMIKNGQSQLVNEKQKMMNDIKGEIVELVTLATARVARMDTDDAHIQNHIKQAIETLK